jgi:hypothetical protein
VRAVRTDALSGRFRCSTYSHAPGVKINSLTRKQTRGMPIFTNSEQYKVEWGDSADENAIPSSRLLSSTAGFDDVDLDLGHWHMAEKALMHHVTVAPWIISRNAALI